MSGATDARMFHQSPRPLPRCYEKLTNDNGQCFMNDFDLEGNLKAFEGFVGDSATNNFLLDFGIGQGWCGFDIERGLKHGILEHRPETRAPRWIQIWRPHEQKDLITAITVKYGLSPRLAAIIRTPPHQHVNQPSGHKDSHHSIRNIFDKSPKIGSSPIDEEKGHRTWATSFETSQRSKGPSAPIKQLDEIDHYDIASSIWHHQSVGFGKRYIALSYNSLYDVKPNVKDLKDGDSLFEGDLPHAHRVWSWYILCDDNTLITITEGTGATARKPSDQVSVLRQHLTNVFLQLSYAKVHPRGKSVSIVPIRKMMKDDEESTEGVAGLLLYYLFDDWTSTFALLAQRNNPYSVELNKLRRNMMEKASLKHVELLHRLGRQLVVLKRLYEAYQIVIGKLLARHEALEKARTLSTSHTGAQTAHAANDTLNLVYTTSGGSTEAPDMQSSNSSSTAHNTNDSRHTSNAYLNYHAVDRFERLQDRINSLVLTEIEEDINLKNQLLNMNFNLITIKQSDSVERLTRITILLAKITILVLPVTLMTGYFSVQIPNTEFTLKKYWIAFGVILAVSLIGLIGFEYISKTVRGWLVYQSFVKALWFLPKSWRTAQDEKKKRDN